MIAKFNKNAKTIFSSKARKDQLECAYRVIDSEFNTVIDCRVYYPGSVCTVALWVHGKLHTSGTGKAGGCGYHVISAAVDDAIDSAGFELYGSPYYSDGEENLKKRCNISGVGEDAIMRALIAIARASSSKRKFSIFKTFA